MNNRWTTNAAPPARARSGDEISQRYLKIFRTGVVTVEDLLLREGLSRLAEADRNASEAMRQLARSTPTCDSATPDTSQPYFLDLIKRIDGVTGSQAQY